MEGRKEIATTMDSWCGLGRTGIFFCVAGTQGFLYGIPQNSYFSPVTNHHKRVDIGMFHLHSENENLLYSFPSAFQRIGDLELLHTIVWTSIYITKDPLLSTC